MKRRSLFTIITLYMGWIFCLPFAVNADSIVDSGIAGNVSWILYQSGKLEFSGKGSIPDYEFGDENYEGAPEWIKNHSDEIRSVVIKEGITVIGDAAFQDCREITEVSIPDTVTSIGANAFLYCENLGTIRIPSSVETIKSGAFYSCSSLSKVELSKGLTEIGGEAFCACDNLNELFIPSSVTTIGKDAFLYDSITLSVTEESAALQYASENNIPYNVVPDSDSSSLFPTIKIDNIIQAEDITKTVSSSPVKFKINATAEGDAAITYSSNSSSIKVNKTSGEVTIPGNYIGGATITITAAETILFNKTSKKITVKSVPGKTSLVGVYNIKSQTAKIRWNKKKGIDGYQIQYASSPDFSDATTVVVNKAKTKVKTISKLKNNTTWYFRLCTYKTVSDIDYCSGWTSTVEKKIKAKSYDTKVYTFTHKKRYKNGAVWGANQKPLISHYSCKGCCAYAADFFASITGNKKGFGKKTFKKVKKIRDGDVIKVGVKQHWFVVLYRIGNKLVTAEGNWGGKVIVSDNTYSISGNKILRNGKKFRPLDTGYHSQ